MEAKDNGDDRYTGAQRDDRGPWSKLRKAIRRPGRSTFGHHSIMSADGEDGARRIEMRLNATGAAPDWKEPTETSQQRRSNAPAPNDEWAEAKPPDPRGRRRPDAECKRLVITTVRRTNKEARSRGGETIQTYPVHPHPERSEDQSQGEPKGTIREACLGPRLAPEPSNPLPLRGWDQGIAAVRAVCPNLSLTHSHTLHAHSRAVVTLPH